jgi:AhpD family alkylhydroperoxidase
MPLATATPTATVTSSMPQPRIGNMQEILPDVLPALLALDKASGNENLPYLTRKLVHLRASQINGCSGCVAWHSRELKQAGEADQRIFAVAAWRDTLYFSEAERAALALAEAATRLSDREDPVPDAVWNEAARHYDEAALAALVVQIALINTFNRLNVPIRHVVGASEW